MPRAKRHIEKPRQRWLHKSEAAEYAGVNPVTIWRWAQDGKVMIERSPRKKNAYIYRVSDIDLMIGTNN